MSAVPHSHYISLFHIIMQVYFDQIQFCFAYVVFLQVFCFGDDYTKMTYFNGFRIFFQVNSDAGIHKRY